MRIAYLSMLVLSCILNIAVALRKGMIPRITPTKLSASHRHFGLKNMNSAKSSRPLFSATTKSSVIELEIEQVLPMKHFFRMFENENRMIEGVFVIDNSKGQTLVADYSSNIFNITKRLQFPKMPTDYRIRIKTFLPSERSIAEKYLHQVIQITKPFFPDVQSILTNDNASWQECSKRASLFSPKKVISPFEHFKEGALNTNTIDDTQDLENNDGMKTSKVDVIDEPLEFSFDSVDKILDDIRPYLQADGGNVALISIDSTARSVKLQLQGACGSCPSSTTTMKFGIERRLQEAFNHSLSSIVAVNANDPSIPSALTVTSVEDELAKLLPAIEQLGGTIKVAHVDTANGTVYINYQGPDKLKNSIDMILKDIDSVEEVIFQHNIFSSYCA